MIFLKKILSITFKNRSVKPTVFIIMLILRYFMGVLKYLVLYTLWAKNYLPTQEFG